MLKLGAKSKTFYKMYVINITLMVCFFGIFSFICTRYSSQFILSNITAFNQQIIDGRRDVLDDKIRQMDEVADAVVANDDVIRLILTDSDQYYSSLKIRNIIGCLKDICSNYSLVDSISLVDYEREIVITNLTKFSLSDKELPAVVNMDPLVFSEEYGETKLRYIKKLNPLQSNKKINIILEVNQEAFNGNLFIPNNKNFKEYLLAKDGTILSADGIVAAESEEGQSLLGTEDRLRGEAESIIYKSASVKTGLSVAGIQNYSELVREADRVAAFIFITCGVTIVLASLILYFFSLYLYRPLKKLNDHISKMEVLKQGKTKNEYDYIESVIDTLQGEKEQIQKKYEEALPVMLQKQCYRLIVEDYEEEAFQSLSGILKREMKEAYYALLLIECEKKNSLHELEERLLHLIHSRPMEAVYVDLNVLQGIFFINTSLPYTDFLNCINNWKSETGDILSTWCVSRYFSNRDNVNLVCWETIGKLKRKFFKEQNSIIYDPPQQTDRQNGAFGQKIGQQLLADIREGSKEKALERLHSFTKELTDSQIEVRYTVFIYFQICDKLLSDLKVADAIISKDYNEKAVFLELFSAENIYELERITAKIIGICLENVGETEKLYSDSVRQTLDFIKSNYHRELTLEDVANEVFLSAGYLSSIFKEETGCTVIEYVTGIRMKRATELLFEIPVIKVKDIAERLGYHNVQSFIRYFKKYYGMTPAEFRKRQQIEE